MRIILGADHGGYLSKEKVKATLFENGDEVIDVGALVEDQEDDYVDYAKKAVLGFVEGDRIILFCRNGFGMSIVANRFKGIRCGIGFDEKAVIKGRNDDNINCLSIPSDYLEEEKLMEIVRVFLNSDFSDNPKYLRRINKIDN